MLVSDCIDISTTSRDIGDSHANHHKATIPNYVFDLSSSADADAEHSRGLALGGNVASVQDTWEPAIVLKLTLVAPSSIE